MKRAAAYVVTKDSAQLVEVKVRDFFSTYWAQQQRDYFRDLDESERRGGCIFKNMGDIAHERRAKIAAELSQLTPTQE